MPSYTRPTKSTGSATFIDGVPLPASDLEGEFTAINTALGTCAPSTGIDAAAVDDYSASASEQKTATSPGTGSSLSAATTLEEEIARLRYKIEELALGIDAKRYDGSSNVDCSWVDTPIRGQNLVLNGSFLHKSTGTTAAPEGWTLAGTPTTCDVITGVVAEGEVRAINLVADASTEGLTQTLKGLKAGARYLAVCRARATSGTARFVISGADNSSQFRPITQTTTSATFVTLKSVFQTDSTPTDVVVQIDAAANGDNVDFTHVAVYECNTDPLATARVPVAFASDITGAVTFNSTSYTTLHTRAVYVPRSGMQVKVTAHLTGIVGAGSADRITAQITQNTSQVMLASEDGTANQHVACSMSYVNTNPAPGLFTYTLDAKRVNASVTVESSSLMVEVA